ncbi:hypothetical protein CTI12_AA200820 [Artemisia annua]|uniref:Uncharacterized protein n=1 Tax=Artemisia annua TaxID=35608 RepID=A0A2U1P0Y7_ARTAN|nr:hypothetical protein CTI12_AA200820 [Artemisia annua]
METRMHDSEVASFKFSFPQYNLLVVNSVRRAGGLLLFWKKDCNLSVASYSKNHIDFVVKEDSGSVWRGTGIYGWPKQQQKHLTWALLRSLSLNQRQGEGWVCFGDFNEILYAFEKMGRRGCNTNEMADFHHACNICNLEDIDATGVKFTWSNGRQGCDNNLARISSDHSPIVCSLKPHVRRRKKMFRFESMWLRDESFHNVVRDAWTSGLATGRESDPCSIVEECAARISEWNKNSFGHVQKSIRAKQKRLQMLQSCFDSSTEGQQHILKEEIKELLTREEVMWKQRSRIQWLREGEDGRWVDDEDDVCGLVSTYFSNLFSSSSPQDCDSIVEDIDQSLTDDDILSLEKHVTEKEVLRSFNLHRISICHESAITSKE